MHNTGLMSQFLLFHAGKKMYGLPLDRIIEIKKKLLITRIPNAPPFIIGVSNLRGKITPLIHFQYLLSEPVMLKNKNRSYIILDIFDSWVGIEVDSVSEVLRLKTCKMSPYEGTSPVIRNCAYGIVKYDGEKILLMNPEALLQDCLSYG